MIAAQFLAQWALRSSILIASSVVLLKALRVKDPSVRLAAWTAILCVSLALPVLKMSLPSLPVETRTTIAAPIPDFQAPPARQVRVVTVEVPAAPAPRRFDWLAAVYCAIAAALLLRLAVGLALSLRLLRRAEHTELAGVRESDHVSSPVTLGIVRPIILLPPDWREWSASKLAAVLAHERSHIARRDPAVQALSAIHRALLWYSPLSWYLDRQIVRLAEQASDDAAIAAVEDRATYAETLLEFMQRGIRRTSWQGVPMARYERPERRLDRILDGVSLSRGTTRWTVAAILALGLPLAYVIAAAQERLTFEAASVKTTTAPPGLVVANGRVAFLTDAHVDSSLYANKGGPGSDDPGRIHYPLIPVTALLKRAYRGYFDVRTPDWADTEVLAVDATMPPTTTKQQFQKMLQNLLVDRFALQTHVETKEITGYALTVVKDGPKFKAATPNTGPDDRNHKDHVGADGFPATPPHMKGIAVMAATNQRARLVGPQATMAELAKEFGDLLDSIVEDRTGLNAKYNIRLDYAGHLGGPRGATALLQPLPPSDDPSAPEPLPDIFSAVQSQLGLKLEKRKVSVEILVVDHMEKTPSGN
ncbi:MAG TPA: M56 family metallopeptidase [Bryobacteraceae bacterium]|jgi:uncharacterized protein (TIGR03435 family)|nr:M56 family metallopeptidase [Bryobacteraceae bacterium]